MPCFDLYHLQQSTESRRIVHLVRGAGKEGQCKGWHGDAEEAQSAPSRYITSVSEYVFRGELHEPTDSRGEGVTEG